MRRTVAEPGAAFGPPGGSGEESISVVAAPLPGAGFALRDLGGPAQAGARFLETVVAPQGSGRATELLSATQRCGRCLHALLRLWQGFGLWTTGPRYWAVRHKRALRSAAL